MFLTKRIVFSLLLVLLAAGIAPQSTPADSTAAASVVTAHEYEIKAAFLTHFLQLTEWPETAFAAPDAPVVIGVLAPDPFGAVLDRAVNGRRVHGRTIEVRRYDRWNGDDRCHLLFVSATAARHLPLLIETLDTNPILTVGEGIEFARHGGMISLVADHDRLRFAVNRQATEQAGLKLSSKLLRLATVVSTEPATGEPAP
jgi:hypothetical protein